MILPELEKTPVLLLRFTSAASPRLRRLVQARFEAGGLLIIPAPVRPATTSMTLPKDVDLVLRITSTQKALEEQAERIRLMKPTCDTKVVDYFTVEQRARFCDPTAVNRDKDGLFTSNEWSLLTHRLLDRITVLLHEERSSELSSLLDSEYKIDCQIHLETDKHVNDGSFRRRLREHGARSACLRHVLDTYGLVDMVRPVHLPAIRDEILHQAWPWYQLYPPVHLIRDYYGWESAFYFAWMGFLTQWLLFPGFLGLAVYLLRWYRNDTIDEDEYTPFYGLVTFLWAVLFLRFWDRHEHRLSYQWGTYALSPYELAVRPDFVGYLRLSPVTGLVETYYPVMRRRLKFIGSAMVTSMMLAVAFTVTIMSLNLQGYIRPNLNPNRWNKDNPHPFHSRTLSALAEEGQFFDAESGWRSFLPVTIHVFCIFGLNTTYRYIAEKLTAWENHETTVNHRNSLVLKRFLFEAFDCYVALFYLAFYERDIDRLREELVAVFQIDTIRRLSFECLLPMLMKRRWWSSRKNTSVVIDPADDADRDEYEQFDDYMEIVIQLGYVTLFASAFPLASLLSIAANWVEVRADHFKLAHLCHRPVVYRSSGLGMWKALMSSVIWMSALTNCLLFGFTSDQMKHYVPGFYVEDERGYTSLVADKGWIVIFVIFGLERLLLVAGLLVYAIIPDTPEDVMNELERRQYIRTRELELAARHDKKKD